MLNYCNIAAIAQSRRVLMETLVAVEETLNCNDINFFARVKRVKDIKHRVKKSFN